MYNQYWYPDRYMTWISNNWTFFQLPSQISQCPFHPFGIDLEYFRNIESVCIKSTFVQLKYWMVEDLFAVQLRKNIKVQAGHIVRLTILDSFM